MFTLDDLHKILKMFLPPLKIVDSNCVTLKYIGNIHNDPLIICLTYCLVLTAIV